MEVRENFSPKGSLIKGIPHWHLYWDHFCGIAASNSVQCEPAEECQCVSPAEVKGVGSSLPSSLHRTSSTPFPIPKPIITQISWLLIWSCYLCILFLTACLSSKLFLNGPVLWICLPSLPIPCCPPLRIQVLSSHPDQKEVAMVIGFADQQLKEIL